MVPILSSTTNLQTTKGKEADQGKTKWSDLTSRHMSLPQKRPVGRPRKDRCLSNSNTKSAISIQQRNPVGRPRKVHINPLSNNGKATTGKFRPLLPRLPNQYLSLLNNSLIQVSSSSQLIKGIESYNNINGVTGTSPSNARDISANLLSSFDDVSDSESHEYGEDDIIAGDNGEYFNNTEDVIGNDAVMCVANRDVGSRYLSLDMPKYKCKFCNAIMWIEERNNKSKSDPTFSICCAGGQIKLPEVKQPPPYLAELLFGRSRHFRDSSKVYNSMFSYTSLGGTVDKLINKNGGGPFCFRLSCQNHHSIGSLVPLKGGKPKFCQLYFYDTENEVDNRMHAFRSKDDKRGPRREIVENLIKMFDEVSPLAKKFRQARDRFKEEEPHDLKIVLKESRSASGRPNHIQPSSDIAAFIVAENDPSGGDRDVVVHTKVSGPQRISFIHPLFMAL